MLNYINFHLFLKSSFTWDIAGAREEVLSKALPQKESSEDVSHLSPKDQEALHDLRKQFEDVKAWLKVVSKREEILRTRLLQEGDPKDKEFWEIAHRIQNLQGELKGLWVHWKELQAELSTLLGEVQTEIKNISPEETKALSKADTTEFLQIPAEKRLQYVTADHTDSADIANGTAKEVIFSFTYEGKLNQNLYKYTTAGQVLPSEVRSVSFGWVNYERMWVNGEFYTKENKRLTIHEGTKISVDKLGTKDEVSTLEKESQNKYDAFIKENPKYGEKEYEGAIKEMYNKWLANEDVMLVLNFSYDKVSSLDKTRAEKLLPVVRHLDNSWLLDSFMDAGEILTKLEEIAKVLKQYGWKLKYSVWERWDIKFSLNDKWLPEWLDVEPSLEKFTQIALSQLGTSEADGGANKYFKDIGFGNIDARNTPWCAAFVNWCLDMSGFKGTQSLAAKSFIESQWFGHVGIKLWDKLLWGNQGNRVSLMNINKPVAGYAIPSEKWLEIHKPAGDTSKIPDGAILVFDRTTKDKHMA